MAGFIIPSRQLTGGPVRDPSFRGFLIVSGVLHLLLLLAAASATIFRSAPSLYSPTYTVDLVSLPPAPAGARPAAATGAQPRQEPAAPQEKRAEPAKDKRVQPPAPSRAVEPAPARQPPADRAGDEAARAKAERLRKIEELEQETQRLYESIRAAGNEAKGSPTEVRPPVAAGGRGPATGAGTAGPVSGAGGAVDLRYKAYYDRIWSQIKAAWVLPAGVAAREQQLLTVVGIRIAPGGNIDHYWIERASGNIYYDQSAIRAINKASPLPPLPRELGNRPLEVGINFRVTE